MTLIGAIFEAIDFPYDVDRECSLTVKSAVLRRGGRRARSREPRLVAAGENEGDVREQDEGGRRRRNELKAQWRPPEAVIYGGITGGGISS